MTDSKKELTFVREFDASREKVFNAWTDPESLKQWWGPEGVFIPVCEMNAISGGRLYIVMEAGESMGQFKGTQWPMEGTFEEVERPSKIIFTSNAVNNGKELFRHRTTVTFEDNNGKTKMTVHVVVTEVFEGSEFAIAGMEQGWNSQFDKLVIYLQS